MSERPRFFDDLAGVAGGAFSALAGLREEVEGTIRARVDETIRKLDLVKREDLEAVQEMAAAARTGQEAAEARLAALEEKMAAITMTMQMAMAMADGVSRTAVPPDASVTGAEAPPAAMPGGRGEAGTPVAPPPVE